MDEKKPLGKVPLNDGLVGGVGGFGGFGDGPKTTGHTPKPGGVPTKPPSGGSGGIGGGTKGGWKNT